MAYTIVKSDGTVLTTIADGTINTTSTSLGLPGRNYAGYGNSLDTNFVHITENFADTTPPPNPLKGQLWFDTSTTPGIMKICPTQYESNAANWITLASSGSNTTFGNLTVTGNLSANNITAVNNSNANAISTNFLTVNTSATITTITTGANTTAGNITGNWTLTPGSSLQATNADFLDGYNSSSSATAATIVLRTGDGSIVANLLYGTIATNAQPNITSVGTLSSLAVTGTATLGTTNTTTITTGANTTAGNITGNWTLTAGSRLQATYADLAERFESDSAYDAGTVVQLGGEKEITMVKYELSDDVFGVVSDSAAYLMNANAGDDKTHPPVAVSGRVQVKVKGKVNKGQRLVSAGEGYARAAKKDEATAFNTIGRALADKNTDGDGTVEAIVIIR